MSLSVPCACGQGPTVLFLQREIKAGQLAHKGIPNLPSNAHHARVHSHRFQLRVRALSFRVLHSTELCTARPWIDRGISLSMESWQVFYGATSSNTTGPQSSSRKICSLEECQMQARKAMLSNVSKDSPKCLASRQYHASAPPVLYHLYYSPVQPFCWPP